MSSKFLDAFFIEKKKENIVWYCMRIIWKKKCKNLWITLSGVFRVVLFFKI